MTDAASFDIFVTVLTEITREMRRGARSEMPGMVPPFPSLRALALVLHLFLHDDKFIIYLLLMALLPPFLRSLDENAADR